MPTCIGWRHELRYSFGCVSSYRNMIPRTNGIHMKTSTGTVARKRKKTTALTAVMCPRRSFHGPLPMKLVSVTGNPDAAPILWELLFERPSYAWISHAVMPTRSEHEAFVANHPFRFWYLIDVNGTYVGAFECTDRNEIGVHILKRHQRKGHGSAALRMFMEKHQPLPPLKAVRNGSWLANIAPQNHTAVDFFSKHGFATVQLTMVKV